MSGAVEGVALLPCPFCGGRGQTLKDADPRYPWYVKYEHASECPLFFVAIGNPQSYRSKSAAITAWNTRTTPPARSYADGLAVAAKHLDERAERARVAAIGGGMDPLDAELLDYEYSNAAAAIRLLSQGEKA